MYAGRVVEQGTLDELFYDPQHPYTWGLLGSITRVDQDRSQRLPAIAGMPPSLVSPARGLPLPPPLPACVRSLLCRCPRSSPASRTPLRTSIAAGSSRSRSASSGRSVTGSGWPARRRSPRDRRRAKRSRPNRARATAASLLDVEHLKVLFPIKSGLIIDRKIGQVHAVDDVSFQLREGKTLGIVGESGCGKTTLIRTLVRLIEPTSGAIRFRGQDITTAGREQLRADQARDADGLPGPAGIAQPAQAHRPDPGHAAAHPGGPERPDRGREPAHARAGRTPAPST